MTTFLRQRISKATWIGFLIAILFVIIITLLITYQNAGTLTLSTIIHEQVSNSLLWLVNLLPILAIIWGQYLSYKLQQPSLLKTIYKTQKKTPTLPQNELFHRSMHDSLTALPNRVLLSDRLIQGLKLSRDNKSKLALLSLDINGFKDINHAIGQHAADTILKKVSQRLQSIVHSPNTLARLGSDDFAIVLPNITEEAAAYEFANMIHLTLETPLSAEDVNLNIRMAIGIAFYPTHGNDSDTLMQHADIAMHMCKKNHAKYIVYSSKLNRHNTKQLILMSDLRHAIEDNQLLLYYQPKIDLKTAQTISAEALVHWRHPELGNMDSNEFIPLAERTGSIKALTQWVLNESLTQCRQWLDANIDISVAVNLSMIDVLDEELPTRIEALLEQHQVPASSLVLELTESTFLTDQELCYKVLDKLSKLGTKLSIDDFGTGYSSLSYLSKLPIDEVKIDRSFVLSMLEQHHDFIIVNAIIGLAHNLDLTVVAEGVASKEIYDRLVKQDCDIGQGFYISRPQTAVGFMDWLNTGNAGKFIR